MIGRRRTSTTRFHCPRRDGDGAMPGGLFWRGKSAKPQDRFEKGHGLVGQRRGCSYCGSMPPDEFMDAVRGGVELGTTTKSYKVYVAHMKGKFYFQHLSEAQRREFVDLYNARPKQTFDPETLAVAQIEGSGMVLGYPGYFPVRPFFMRPLEDQS